MLAWPFAILLGQRIVHGCHLAHIGADVVDRHAGDRRALCIGGKLDVVGWTETTISHLHHPCLRIGRGGSWLADTRLFACRFLNLSLLVSCSFLLRFLGRTLGLQARLLLLSGVQFLAYRQRCANPALAILSCSLTGRGLLATGRTRIGVYLRTQIGQRLLGIAPAVLQGRMPAKRSRSRRGAHPHAILGNTI